VCLQVGQRSESVVRDRRCGNARMGQAIGQRHASAEWTLSVRGPRFSASFRLVGVAVFRCRKTVCGKRPCGGEVLVKSGTRRPSGYSVGRRVTKAPARAACDSCHPRPALTGHGVPCGGSHRSGGQMGSVAGGRRGRYCPGADFAARVRGDRGPERGCRHAVSPKVS